MTGQILAFLLRMVRAWIPRPSTPTTPARPGLALALQTMGTALVMGGAVSTLARPVSPTVAAADGCDTARLVALETASGSASRCRPADPRVRWPVGGPAPASGAAYVEAWRDGYAACWSEALADAQRELWTTYGCGGMP